MFSTKQLMQSTANYINQFIRSDSSASSSGYNTPSNLSRSSSSIYKRRHSSYTSEGLNQNYIKSQNSLASSLPKKTPDTFSQRLSKSQIELSRNSYLGKKDNDNDIFSLPSQLQSRLSISDKKQLQRTNNTKSDKNILANNLNLLFNGEEHKEIRDSLNKIALNIKNDSYVDKYGLHRQRNNAPCAYLSHINGIRYKNENTLYKLKEKLFKFKNRIDPNYTQHYIDSTQNYINASNECLNSIDKIIKQNPALFASSSRLEAYTMTIHSSLDFLKNYAKNITQDEIQEQINIIYEKMIEIDKLHLKTNSYDLVNSIAEHTYTLAESHMYDEAVNLNKYYKNNVNDGNTSILSNTFRSLKNINTNSFFNITYHNQRLYELQIDFIRHIFTNINKNTQELYNSVNTYLKGTPLIYEIFNHNNSRYPNTDEEIENQLNKTTNEAIEFIKNFKQNGVILTNPSTTNSNIGCAVGHHQGIFYDRATQQVVMVNSAIEYNKDTSFETRIHTGNLYSTNEVNKMLSDIAKKGEYCISTINQGKGSMPVYGLRTANALRHFIKKLPKSIFFEDRLRFLREA